MYLFSNPTGDQPSEPCRSKVAHVGDKYPGDRDGALDGNVGEGEQPLFFPLEIVKHVHGEQEKRRVRDHDRHDGERVQVQGINHERVREGPRDHEKFSN